MNKFYLREPMFMDRQHFAGSWGHSFSGNWYTGQIGIVFNVCGLCKFESKGNPQNL